MTPGRALGARNAIDTSKERQVFFDAQIVIQREFLGHVPELLADSLRAQAASLSRELHLAGRGTEETAQHLDRGCLSSAVFSEQALNLSVLQLHIYVRHSG